MSEFLHMGGYGAYVWTCFGLTGLVLFANAIAPYIRLRQLRRELTDSVDEDDLHA